MPYVEAELDRRHPVRLLIRSDKPADLRGAWRQLRDDWATTTERVRSMPENSEHHGVDGEWVGGRNPASPCLRARLLVSTLRARAPRAVHGHRSGSTVRHGPGGERARPVRPTDR